MVSSSGDTLLEARTVVVNELMLLLLSELFLSSLRAAGVAAWRVAGAVDAMDGYDTGWAWTPRESTDGCTSTTVHYIRQQSIERTRTVAEACFFFATRAPACVMASAGGVCVRRTNRKFFPPGCRPGGPPER